MSRPKFSEAAAFADNFRERSQEATNEKSRMLSAIRLNRIVRDVSQGVSAAASPPTPSPNMFGGINGIWVCNVLCKCAGRRQLRQTLLVHI